MAQEFTINSSAIESKINQLLPSQGGLGAGVDFSASTMVIPIVDLTESAEGSGLREDLQTSLSHNTITSFNVSNTTTTIISTTGYFRVFGTMSVEDDVASGQCNIFISDGSTNKIVLNSKMAVRYTAAGILSPISFDFIVFLEAGDSLKALSNQTYLKIAVTTRQIADISGNLVNP